MSSRRERRRQGDRIKRGGRARRQERAAESKRLYYLLGGGVLVVVAAVVAIVVAGLDSSPEAVSVSEGAVQAGASVGGGGETVNMGMNALGPADAPVTLVEFGDFQCSHCAQFALVMGRQLKKDYVDTGQIRFVFRHYPFLGKSDESFRAAEATECAADQGKFWEYHDTLFENWKGVDQGAYSDENLKGFASSLQLDRGAFDTCLDGGKYRGKVEEDLRAGDRMGVRGTPALFLQGRMIQVADYTELAALIESAIEAAQ